MCRSVRRHPRSWYNRLAVEVHSTRCNPCTGLRSGELGGQSVGGIKSGVCCSSSATVSLARCDGHCPAERRKTRSRCRTDVRKQYSSQNDVAFVYPIDCQQQRVDRSESHCYWRVASACRLRACVRSGGGHFEHIIIIIVYYATRQQNHTDKTHKITQHTYK